MRRPTVLVAFVQTGGLRFAWKAALTLCPMSARSLSVRRGCSFAACRRLGGARERKSFDAPTSVLCERHGDARGVRRAGWKLVRGGQDRREDRQQGFADRT